MNKSFLFLIVFGIIAILSISGCTQKEAAINQTPVVTQTPAEQTPAKPLEQPVIKLSSDNYIVDDSGMTLYLFAQDIMGDSKCTGTCLNIWPVFYQEKIAVSSGLNSTDFGMITRDDGNGQTTYKGWPLYYYSGDSNPGDIKGDGINNVWFIARPDYAILIANNDSMKFLVDGQGNTLYSFAKDTPDMSNCAGSCLNVWPAFYNEKIVVPSNMDASDFGVITNSQGSKQTTYKQMPLYYYVNDTKRGDTNGQGVINAWFVVNPEATPVSTVTPTSVTPTSVATQTGGGGSGY